MYCPSCNGNKTINNINCPDCTGTGLRQDCVGGSSSKPPKEEPKGWVKHLSHRINFLYILILTLLLGIVLLDAGVRGQWEEFKVANENTNLRVDIAKNELMQEIKKLRSEIMPSAFIGKKRGD